MTSMTHNRVADPAPAPGGRIVLSQAPAAASKAAADKTVAVSAGTGTDAATTAASRDEHLARLADDNGMAPAPMPVGEVKRKEG